MPFFPPNPRNRPFQQPYRQGFGPNYQGMQEQPFYYPHQQYPAPRFGRLPENLNMVIGHAGRVYYGVNMLRQVGSFLSLFR